MRLLNQGDEALLYEVFSQVFKDSKILQDFYLGYCVSSDRVHKCIIDPNSKFVLPHQGFYLPLLSDWFIRPLFYLEHMNADRVGLIAAILDFAVSKFTTKQHELLRVTKSEFMMCLFNASQ